MSLSTAQKAAANHLAKVLHAIASTPDRLGAFFTSIPLTSLFDLDIGALLDKVHSLNATADEINAACDVSAQTQAIVASGGTITVDGTIRRVTLTNAVNGATTLPAPGEGMKGKTLVIEYIGAGTNNATIALTNVQGGSAATTATFNAANETLVLIGGESKWNVLKEVGVTLA